MDNRSSEEKQLHITKVLQRFYHSRYKFKTGITRNAQNLMGLLLSPLKGIEYTEFMVEDVPCLWVRREESTDSHYKILYCHGGGYTTGDLQYTRIISSKLCRLTGLDVLAFAYPLAPESIFPAQLNAAEKVYRYLNKSCLDIAVVGESAGGHLALDLTLRLREMGEELPRRLLLMSPWTDLTMTGQSYITNVKTDILIGKEYVRDIRYKFAPDMDYTNEYLSPVNADFSGFPQTLIQVGSHELLLSDSFDLCKNMRKAGVNSAIHIYEGMGHVFQMFPESILTESGEAMEEAKEFLLNWAT